ncbi:MAG: glutamyl-tRNA reductase [bacterium]|nr:glutamyl-tRNA reductase [Deltaproteobacteria bacterium]MCP4904186.1 glutamyl-tRNA reductase [bacterium]
MKVVLLGMNHRTAPVEVRERFAAAQPEPLLRKLIDRPEIAEATLLSTCNRVEIVVTTPNPDGVEHVLLDFFARDLAGGELPASASLKEMTYLRRGREAVEHVFRVASSIDSMVVGEPQILGQVKDAYREAIEAGSCGAVLSRLFQRSFATAKRVKNETGIAQRPVSVARVAVDLARQIFEHFEDKSALLIGAGEMIEAALVALDDHGLGTRRVANRTAAHAEALARRFSGTAHGLDEVDALLADSDVVLTCIGGDGPILTRESVGRSLVARRGKPLFLIDIGVPRNIDPGVHELDSAYLYNLDDLQEIATANERERRLESERAERIVYEEREQFEGWMVALQAVPTIRDLRDRAEEIRRSEIDRFAGRLRLDGSQGDVLEQLTRTIVNKIMHAPISRLRDETDREAGLVRLEEARALFALDDEGTKIEDEEEPDE